jgi:hypothetical protein
MARVIDDEELILLGRVCKDLAAQPQDVRERMLEYINSRFGFVPPQAATFAPAGGPEKFPGPRYAGLPATETVPQKGA